MRATKIDLHGLNYGIVDIDNLPLTSEEKEIVAKVQRQDRVLSNYLHEHHGGHDLIQIEDVPSLEGDTMDLRAGRVFELPTGIEHKFYRVGHDGQYLEDFDGVYLHRLSALQYTRLTDKKKYEDAMQCPAKYEVHHKNPAIRKFPHGNGITNVVLLEKGLHHQYTAITKKLRDLAEFDGVAIPLIKDWFYLAI